MKHKLLSLVALSGAMLVSASAMAWDDPVQPTRPKVNQQFQGSFVEPEDGRQYYIYNVGAGLFLGGGQTWGTRAIVLCDSVISVTEEAAINNVSGNTTANYVLPFELVATGEPGQYNINVLANSKATAGAGHFVGEDGAQAWIDGDNDRNASFGLWSISQYEDGYMITNDYATNTKYADAPRAYGVDGNNTAISWATTWTDLYLEKPEGNTTDPQLVWKFVSADDFDAVSAYSKAFKEAFNSEEFQAQVAAYDAAMAVYNKKLDLKAALEDAEAAGINTDAAGAVYTKADATLAEVEDAISTLRAAIAAASLDFSGASEDTPLDVTSMVILNADFSSGNIDGWVDGYTTGNASNHGYQGASYTNGDVTISQFIECWRSNASPFVLGDGKAYYTIYGLPAGKYKLEADIIANYQWSDAAGHNPGEGAYLYIGAGNNIARESVHTGNEQPEHFSVTFIHDGAPMTEVGIMTESATINWFAADNFQLTYFGATAESVALANLRTTITEAETFDMEQVRASKETKDAFKAALEAANAAISSAAGDEAYDAANNTLKAAMTAMKASINEYAAVGKFIEKLNDMIEKVSANNWEDLADNIDEWAHEIDDAYIDGTITTEDIAGFEDKLQQMIRDFIATPGAVKEGDDLTMLIVNADFETLGANNKTVPGWTVVSGAITDHSTAFHNIEGYHTTFDIQQTIKNMPAGAYDITVQGFVANEGTQECELYAGASATSFKEIKEEYSLYAILSNGTDEVTGLATSTGAWPYDRVLTLEDGTTAYTPNSMEGAKLYFEQENPITGEPYYTNHAVIILPEDGDLTIGVRTTGNSEWILWDNFRMTYAGYKAEYLYPEIERMTANLLATAENENTYLTQAASQLVETLPAKANAAVDNAADTEECIAIINELSEAIKYIKAGNKLFDELDALANNIILDRIMMNPHSDSDYETLATTAANCKESADSFADNDAVAAMTAQVKSGWVKYVMSDISDDNNAENPYDATDVIFNPDFELENADYWNINISGGNQGYQGAQYINTKEDGTEIVISKFVETWRGDASLNDGNISQTLFGALPAGFYRLEMDGYATNQAGIPEEGVQGAYLYVQIGDARMLAPIGITATEGKPEHFTLDFYSNGTDVPTLGLWIEGANCNWAAADNFKLFYIGQEAPDAVESLAAKTNSNAAIAIYGIDGRQQSQLRRGINIVRTAEGTRKVMVK